MKEQSEGAEEGCYDCEGVLIHPGRGEFRQQGCRLPPATVERDATSRRCNNLGKL